MNWKKQNIIRVEKWNIKERSITSRKTECKENWYMYNTRNKDKRTGSKTTQ